MRRPPFALELRRVLVLGPQAVLELRQLLAVNDVEVLEAQTSSQALDAARREGPELAIVDVAHVSDGYFEAIATLRAALPDLVIGAVSAAMTDELAASCRRIGARWCLTRPFSRADLYEAIIVHGLPLPTMLRVDLPLEEVPSSTSSASSQPAEASLLQHASSVGPARHSSRS